jgi:hypothetical protein
MIEQRECPHCKKLVPYNTENKALQYHTAEKTLITMQDKDGTLFIFEDNLYHCINKGKTGQHKMPKQKKQLNK